MPNYKILIADYEPRGIQQLRDPLESAGYSVEVAKDGIKAIEAFNSFKPHLTLIEAMLPKKHGFEVCEELKKTQHGSVTPIVIVTSVYKGRKYRTQALHHYRCDEYLEKPIAADHLLATVQRLIGDAQGVPASAPAAAPVAPSAKPATPPQAPPVRAIEPDDGGGEAEIEIMERLDEIMPGESAPAHSKFGKR
jgi:DNA-binding response OmpR family regulator